MLCRVFSLLLLLWPLSLGAEGLPAPLTDTVSDYADLLSPDAEARVSAALTAGRSETGVHVVLVAMNSIADHGGAGQRIEDYAKQLFNAWGVGDATRDDGILILIARGDREMRIALGAGYEVIWDNAAQRVIDRHFLPAFRNDDYVAGIEAGVPATFDLIARPFVGGDLPEVKTASRWDTIVPLAIFGVLATGMIGFFARVAMGDALVRFKKCPTCGSRSLTRARDVVVASTKTTTGHGQVVTHCSACGWDRREPYTISRQTEKSDSSGGFGGGSSSGGGATGRW